MFDETMHVDTRGELKPSLPFGKRWFIAHVVRTNHSLGKGYNLADEVYFRPGGPRGFIVFDGDRNVSNLTAWECRKDLRALRNHRGDIIFVPLEEFKDLEDRYIQVTSGDYNHVRSDEGSHQMA